MPESLKYRLMAHTAEVFCEEFCIPPEERDRAEHDDIHHGFILAFQMHNRAGSGVIRAADAGTHRSGPAGGLGVDE
ncbi:MAG: hypothetical protein ACLU9S_10915 [Oscillospiraceae bacterium]